MLESTQCYCNSGKKVCGKAELNNLHTKKLGRNYVYYEEIDSTQKEIWRRIEDDSIVDGILIRANKQTSGIGTHGRTWQTEANNIAFSFYMNVSCDIAYIEGITIKIAETIINVINNLYEIQLEITPPNDIYVKGKKLGGILTQTKLIGGKVRFLVVGIGMNNSQESFDGELKDIATSFMREYGIEVDVEGFIAEFCNEFEKLVPMTTNDTAKKDFNEGKVW